MEPDLTTTRIEFSCRETWLLEGLEGYGCARETMKHVNKRDLRMYIIGQSEMLLKILSQFGKQLRLEYGLYHMRYVATLAVKAE